MIFKTPSDQLRAHALMLANLDAKPVYWLHFAQIYGEVPGRPVMLLARAETCAIIIARLDGPVLKISYREAGIYFGAEGDAPLSEFKNPITGKVGPVTPTFREGPAVFTRTASDSEIVGNTELDQKAVRPMSWTWHSSGPRVWMINEDAGVFAPGNPNAENVQARDPLGGRIVQTWHADRRDFGDPALASVPCFKNYSVSMSAWLPWFGDPGERGSSFIRGMGAKLTAAQAAASPEFTRLNRFHGDFFAAGAAA